MTWNWHAAYVQATSQMALVEVMKKGVELYTDHDAWLVGTESAGHFRQACLDLQFICVSNVVNGQVAVWGCTAAFLARLLRDFGLSGILLAGEDHELEEPIASDHWTYMVFEKGQLTDWYVSNPEFYFTTWSDHSLQEFAVPFVYGEKKVASPLNVIALREHWALFGGNSERLWPYVKDGISLATVKAWLAARPIEALAQVAHVLSVPFSGSAYHPFAMAVYFDLRHQPRNPAIGPNEVEASIWEIYDRLLDRASELERFVPLVFSWVNAASTEKMYLDYGERFSW